MAAGLPHGTMIGLVYGTNSTLASRYPNEWEFFAQASTMRQEAGRPFDLGVALGYNLAVDGVVGELSLGRRAGRARFLASGRLLTDPRGGAADAAVGGGAVVRLGRWVALAADVATIVDRAPGEQAAWSAGLQLGVPQTPHTLSLQATNAAGIGLENASRGASRTLYGFEFTIPLTLRRYSGARAAGPAPAAQPVAGSSGAPAVIHVRSLAFGSGAITITEGTVVEWVNDDPLAHSVVAGDSSFDSGLIEPGATWRHTFAAPGTFAYACRPHPFMKGTIIVVPRP
jgi:plastocyanin